MKTIKKGKYTLVGKDDIMIQVDEHDKITNLNEIFSYFHVKSNNYFNKQNVYY